MTKQRCQLEQQILTSFSLHAHPLSVFGAVRRTVSMALRSMNSNAVSVSPSLLRAARSSVEIWLNDASYKNTVEKRHE
jgi:hypothetical protein